LEYCSLALLLLNSKTAKKGTNMFVSKLSLTKLLLSASLAFLAISGSVNATPITYDLTGVTFADGTSATGKITFDATTHTSSSFSVVTTAGTLGAFTFDNSDSALYFGSGAGPNNFILMTTNGLRVFNFSFLTPFTDAGATEVINIASSYECLNCSPFRRVTAGSLVAEGAVVPEPTTVALLGLGLLGFAAGRRKSAK
jgi:hypothetical protein